jgi:peptide methionine sulfoxide reductase MsrA
MLNSNGSKTNCRFYQAEAYHQDYVVNNPNEPYVQGFNATIQFFYSIIQRKIKPNH